MKKLLAAFLFFISFAPVHAQAYSRIRVYANQEQMQVLHQLGICLDHGKHKTNTWIETDLSAEEINTIQAQGIQTEVLIADVQQHYQDQVNQAELRASTALCNTVFENYTMPQHFKYGSMGGYPTYAQIMSELDSMFILYPTLVKQKTGIGSHLTHQGHTIDWMKISDNPNADENEPEILFTALHHSREPASAHQLLYFMWYILEHYGSDPEITWLVDHTEIYFVPVVNPDGYLYNESTHPLGGGMWRKNRRNNGDGTYGVDLNRNYSYQWGVSGTSGTTSSDVYKGPSAFSEPETKAIRDFSIARQFKMAINYHTFGNLLLHPYGYGYVTPVDDAQLRKMGSWLVSQSDLISEQAVTLYPASGDSDDWMYGDVSLKPKIFAFTPELGEDGMGFWPPMAAIEDICLSSMFQNITAVKMLHHFCVAKENNPEVYRNGMLTQYFKYDLEKLGMADTGTSVVSLVALSPYILSTGPARTYTNLTGFVVQADSIVFTLDPAIPQGTAIKFVLQCQNNTGTVTDTVIKYVGVPYTIHSNDFSTIGTWSNTGFSTTNTTYISPNFSITDSPGGNYSAGANKFITSPDILIPATAVFAQVKFHLKWAIEDGYDYAQMQISTDNGASFTPLCGKYTNKGTNDQMPGKPVYDGVSDWVMDEVNLNDYIGQTVRLRLRFRSDAGVHMDGVYMDDIAVEIINVTGIDENENYAAYFSVWPNPAGNMIYVNNQRNEKTNMQVTDIYGKKIGVYILEPGINQINLPDPESGYYLLQMQNSSHTTARFKINIVR